MYYSVFEIKSISEKTLVVDELGYTQVFSVLIGIGCLCLKLSSAGGIMVSIAAFQAVDPGSIPGQRRWFFMLF